ncbi:hypothetical protein L6452_21033 [Arctium lappa]|uniref:Uncharacterized protein n=1 Tax=Arctium lappa TaxID=4217 RepID=A0ACB9BEX8_ARCLA|nr:hypothetical protein L6452_21033 [Arctium lappa]
MNTPDLYYQKYECETWKSVNSDTEQSSWQRKLDISSCEPAQQKKAYTQQELQAQQLTDQIQQRAQLLDPVDYYRWDYGTIVGNKIIKTRWMVDSEVHEEQLRHRRLRY